MTKVSRLIMTEAGGAIIQVMVAASLVAAGGVYMMKSMQVQEKSAKNATNKGAESVLRRELAEVLTDPMVCLTSIGFRVEGGQQITSRQVSFNGVKNESGTMMYALAPSAGSEFYGMRIKAMKLVLPQSYVADGALKYQEASLSVAVELMDRIGSKAGSFGGKDIAIQIPMYLGMKDNKLITCLSDDSENVADAVKLTCEELKGTYNLSTGNCDDLRGENSYVNQKVKQNFCQRNNLCDIHPYAGLVCPPYTDGDGITRNNWVVTNFTDTEMICTCVPVRECPDQNRYCPDQNLGYNGCGKFCGFGTKTETWSPSRSSACVGQQFTQGSNCGRTRDETGTRTDGPCAAP